MTPLLNPIDNVEADDWWLDQDGRFHVSLLPLDDLLWPYCVLGLLRYQVDGAWTKLTWDLERVDQKAFAQAQRLLAEMAPTQRVRLAFRKDAWAEERYRSPSAALRRIDQLSAFLADRVAVAPQTTIERQPIERLEGSHREIREAMQTWRGQSGTIDWTETASGRRGILLQDRGDSLVFRHIGTDSDISRMLGDHWRELAIDTPCDAAFDDTAFNRRVNASYRTAMVKQEPVYEHIMAHIERGDHAIWLPYQRLVLPVPEGVAVFTRITEDIDLAFLGRPPACERANFI